jgi:hypothetical protein
MAVHSKRAYIVSSFCYNTGMHSIQSAAVIEYIIRSPGGALCNLGLRLLHAQRGQLIEVLCNSLAID